MCFISVFCFFKQKTAYERRISDWSSDVCSSDLHRLDGLLAVFHDLAVVLDHLIGFALGQNTLGDQLVGIHLARARMLADALVHKRLRQRSEESRVGKECVSTCRSRWSPSH